ncbi:MAG TPA: hypothetical protein VNO70_14125 [Blastocatellia bacterium]|nr:hypothetical protein [Blastocatellia bacterium]
MSSKECLVALDQYSGRLDGDSQTALSLDRASVKEAEGLYVTGGRQRNFIKTDEWHQYGKGVIVRVNTMTGSSECCVEYETPSEACSEEQPSITFKAGTLVGNRLYICTSTEVLVYQVPEFKRVGYISLPCFNDLHHVCVAPDGSLLVANTGLDMVVEVTPDGRVSREWGVLGEDPWERFSRGVDYRKVVSTKPHKSHPNFVFKLGDEVWVTRFHQRDAICLTSPNRRIAIGAQGPHDGAAHNGHIYFTTVDGKLVIVNQHTLKTEEVVDLNEITGQNIPLGWCRGLKVIDERKVWVGFSRFRPTKFKENVSWIRNGFKKVLKPTHIALYDIYMKECLKEINLEPSGINTVFSIFAEPTPAG